MEREGRSVFLTGRTLASVAAVVEDISAAGGAAESAQVDALNESAVEKHISDTIDKAGRIDISFNAIGIPAFNVRQENMQGMPLAELPLESCSLPITTYVTSHFLTARAAARHMVKKRSGVILMHTQEPARLGVPLLGGMAPARAAMEALSRGLSAEFGSQGVNGFGAES